MTLDYNISLQAAVIPVDIVLCFAVVMLYKEQTRLSTAFRRLAFAVTITNIVDVLTAIVTSMHALIPNPVHYLFNTLDSALAGLSGLLFVFYVYAYSSAQQADLKLRKRINVAIYMADLFLLLTNPFTGWVFTYDEAGNYILRTLFVPVAYGFPILFFTIGSIYVFTHRERYKKSQLIAMTLSIVIGGVLFLLQMLFFNNFLITFYFASIGILIIYLSLETPEHQRLVHVVAELREARVREAALQEKDRLSREIMIALSKAVDAKDHYTNGHSERVAEYAREIARRMGKTENEQEEIYELGLLHDIGKIGIREDIINKESKLTEAEFAEIKKHTVIGWEILKTINEIPWLSKGARWHHERFDGRGYPDGLAGTDIPEEARIICLADSYDAMTSKRSYSSPKAQSEVRKEIIRCSGSQFDPQIAVYLIQMIDEDKDFLLREQPVSE